MENKIDNLEVSTLLEEQDPNKHIRTLATIISVIVIIAIIWASVTTIDELTKAPGVIKPSGQSQIIKHIEGGKVKTVLKTNGDFVVQGDEILVLAPNQDVADRDTLLSRQHSIELEILRHEYFAASTKITQLEIRENIESTPNNMLAQESLDLISQENNTYTSKKSILQESIDKELTALKQLGKQLINRTKRVGILKQANEIYEELELSNSVSKIKVIDAREKLNETEADLLSIETKIEAQKHTLDQKQQELSAFKDKSNYENMQKLNKARASHMEIQEALEHYIDQSENLKIKATVSGIIQDLIFDVGTVISPGEQILEIVPSQRELIVKAKLPSKHIANIRLGNPVKVRVSSYNYIRYGSLNGKVESISISTFSEKNLAPYYKINIRLDQNTLATSKIDLLPGMTVTADIVSGNRTIIEYLLRPIIHSVKMAFTEH